MSRTSIATDNFNRPAIGADWTQLNDGWGSIATVSSLYFMKAGNGDPTAGTEGAAVWAGTGTFADDQYASAVLVTLEWQSGKNYTIGVICRASTDTNANRDYYWAGVAHDNSASPYTTMFGKVVNGTTTTFYEATAAWAVNDRIELECEGTTIRVLKNGVALGGSFTTTDSAIASGKPGIMAGGTTTTQGDNWDGGSLLGTSPAGADTTTTGLTDTIRPVSVSLSIAESG